MLRTQSIDAASINRFHQVLIHLILGILFTFHRLTEAQPAKFPSISQTEQSESKLHILGDVAVLLGSMPHDPHLLRDVPVHRMVLVRHRILRKAQQLNFLKLFI